MVENKLWRLSRIWRGALAVALLSMVGCGSSGYNLSVGGDFYRKVDHQARSRNPGTIHVVFIQDSRPSGDRDHHNFGTKIVRDSDWSEGVSLALIRLLQQELYESRLFSTAVQMEGEHDFRLEISLRHFRGTWVGGYWNLLLPWTKMYVAGRVHLVLSIWGSGGQNVYFYKDYDRTTEQYVSNYTNGYRKAAQLLGDSLHWIVQRFLQDLEARIREFPLPPGSIPEK